MNKIKTTSLLCGGILSLTGGSLLAQQSPSQTSPTTPPSSTSPSSTDRSLGQGGQTSTSLAGRSGMHSGQSVRLSQIMNGTVQSQEGKTLGYIRDLTVDPQSGQVEFAILSLSTAGSATDTSTSGRETTPSSRSTIGGTPSATAGGMTGKLIPIPWQMFSQSWSSSRAGTPGTSTTTTTPGAATAGFAGAQTLVLNVDESKLRSAPSFEASDWNQLQQGTLDQRVYSHFGVDRSSGVGTPGSSTTGQGVSGQSDRSGQGGTSRPQGGTSPQGGTTSPDK